MVQKITQLAAGNALQVLLRPPPSCRRWRLLRSTVSVIPSHDHAGATLVHDGRDATVVDTDKLVNGTTYYYRAFYLLNGTWQASPAVSATPASSFIDATNDHVEFVRERIELGLAALVDRGALSPNAGFIPVLSSSPELDHVRFPCVTVHLASDADSVRGVGEEFGADEFDDDDELLEHEGWLSALQFTVIVWATNGDERKLLRRQLKAVLMANLPVFDSVGIVQVSMSFSDQEDFETYPAPMYQAVAQVSCMAPSLVARPVPVIAEVCVLSQAVEHTVPVTR